MAVHPAGPRVAPGGNPVRVVAQRTDAGGTGLNLQHATPVVHVDLPWNPAVLEQRTGRVHRIGQARPVQVISFVAEASIEQRMVGLIGFKESLFAGALDGGDAEVTLEGSRLNQFMDNVEETAAPIEDDAAASGAQPAALTPGEPIKPAGPSGQGGALATGAVSPADRDASGLGAAAEEPSGDNQQNRPRAGEAPWMRWMTFGRTLVGALRDRWKEGSDDNNPARSPLRVEADNHTGERYLRLPMPRRRKTMALADALRVVLPPYRRR